MAALLAPLVSVYSYILEPIAPFTWFGVGLSTLDVLAAARLCVALRQMREALYKEHVRKHGSPVGVEHDKSFVRDIVTTWTVVYGGEAVANTMLGTPPSFVVSGVVPAFYAAMQWAADSLPAVPAPSRELELPLSIFDGFSRAFLLCNLIPPVVVANAQPALATSAWTLLLTSFITANGGFFLTNMFSFLNPTPLSLQTPPELRAYGWTTTDLWCAPLVTGLFALLTHAQPFWADAHNVLSGILSAADKPVEAVDPETARAACALLLAVMFSVRTTKNFPATKKETKADGTGSEAKKTQ
ncbi:hypothetical protein FB107DRAFT_208443 [Schizophyllum commune]